MIEKLAIGRTLTVEWVVSEEHSAERFGNPGVPVFATPAVVWLLDSLAHQCLVPTLDPEQGTLGTRIEIHDYDNVDNEILWDVVQSKLGPLKAQVETVLQNNA